MRAGLRALVLAPQLRNTLHHSPAPSRRSTPPPLPPPPPANLPLHRQLPLAGLMWLNLRGNSVAGLLPPPLGAATALRTLQPFTAAPLL